MSVVEICYSFSILVFFHYLDSPGPENAIFIQNQTCWIISLLEIHIE